jgi:hypothetical protein
VETIDDIILLILVKIQKKEFLITQKDNNPNILQCVFSNTVDENPIGIRVEYSISQKTISVF